MINRHYQGIASCAGNQRLLAKALDFAIHGINPVNAVRDNPVPAAVIY
jgi:hypothetical protein